MDLKPEEISKIIKAQIKQYDQKLKQDETGTIILVGDGIARASGLESCMANELVEFENGEYGMALNLEEDSVSIVILGSDVGLLEGSIVRRTGRVVSVPVGEELVGLRRQRTWTERGWKRLKLRPAIPDRLKARHRASLNVRASVCRCKRHQGH